MKKRRKGVRVFSLAIFFLMFFLFILLLVTGGNATENVTKGGGSTSEIIDKLLNKIPWWWWIAPLGSLLALFYAFHFYSSIKKANPGDAEMVRIASYVKKGAKAYLAQQYKIVFWFFIVMSGVLSVLAFVLKAQSPFVPFAFFTGGFFSGLCGYLGMLSATDASSRTTQGAKESLNNGLRIAFRAGSVMGLIVVGFGLLDICLWFIILYVIVGMDLHTITVTMLCFGMGASSQALFARVGGGIYTKAADVGADLVGKVEAGIPEDDPRNPAVIADNVGDNVGDVAGMGADLYESYCGSILAAATLGFSAALTIGSNPLYWILLPMVIAGVGNILSIIGIYAVRTKEDVSLKNLMASLFRGINLSSFLILIFSGMIVFFIFQGDKNLGKEFFGVPIGAIGIWIAIVSGLIGGVIIGKSTEYYTSNDFKPTQGIAKQAATGPATVIIDGISVGMLSTGIPVIVVGAVMLVAFILSGGLQHPNLGLFGISVAAVGMLSTLGITLATDAYGPIADNAGGNAQMTHQQPYVRERTDALDALGNTTAATGKGFAIGSAALTALALLAAYIEEVRIGIVRLSEAEFNSTKIVETVFDKDEAKTIEMKKIRNGVYAFEAESARDKKVQSFIKVGERESENKKVSDVIKTEKAELNDFMNLYHVTLMEPKVIVGIFLGAMMVFVFCALTLKAVGRNASRLVQEVRKQFRTIPGILENKAEPDYAACVSISTKGAQREMILPSLLAITIPVATGIAMGVSGVMGLLAGAMACGFTVAVMMANSGGAWDNAKKWIEAGKIGGGKGTADHKASVVGDTVGDPFKDTAGPSLNILIKLMSMVSVVFAGLVIKFTILS